MTENQFQDDDLFDSMREYKNQYSIFIEELQQSTEKLMNEVFNAQYVPHINEEDLNFNHSENNDKAKQSNVGSLNSSRKKNFTSHDFNNSKRTQATKCSSQRELSDSFVNFLTRNQKWKQRRIDRAKNSLNRKQQQELRGLTFVPSILRASRQKVMEPIYERCLQIQKDQQKKMAVKRMQKQREQTEKQSQYNFQPTITTKAKNRTLQEYLQDKEEWHNRKVQFIQNQRLWQDAKKLEQCIFHPVLIAKNPLSKTHTQQKPMQQKVEDRLLRGLQKSIQRKQQIRKNTFIVQTQKLSNQNK